MDAVKEFKWFVVIVIFLGIIWISSGGLKSATKNNPFIKPAQPLSTGETYGKNGFFSYMFPFMQSSNASLGGGYGLVPMAPAKLPTPTKTETQTSNGISIDYRPTKTYYGAEIQPGPTIKPPSTLQIERVFYSTSNPPNPKDEYTVISAPTTNKGPVLLTGIVLKSRMTGTQQDIRDGIPIYYTNTVNKKEPIFLKPGGKAYIMSGKSPFGYSFQTNKCIGYIANNSQNFVIPLPTSGCPTMLDYPWPDRPNAFSDNCVDFLRRIRSCQSNIKYPTNIEASCKNFAYERTNYVRCVQDFGNDPDFMRNDWRIYLNREQPLWKTRREIVDLLDQSGNLLDTYVY